MARAGGICVNITKKESEFPVWEQVEALHWNQVEIRDASPSESMNYFSDDTQDDNFSDSDGYSSDGGDEGEESKLREYQKELAKVALDDRSSIICAPTGSGKTNVAIYIISEHLKKYPDAKVAFFARTVPLAKQQYLRIKGQLPRSYEMLLMTGESELSMSLHKLLPQYNVVVLTPMILVNHLCGRRPLLTEGVSAFSLLVFDECHHTREGEPYNKIMYYYLQEKRQKRKMPQVVGLTASIGVEKAVDIEPATENIMNVCGNLDVDHVAMVRRNTEELRDTVPVPEEEEQELVKNEIYAATLKILDIMQKLEGRAAHYAREGNDAFVSMLMTCIPQPKKHQKYCQWTVELLDAAKVVAIDDTRRETVMPFRNINIISQYLKEYHFAVEAMELAQVRDVIKFLERSFAHFRRNTKKATDEAYFYQLFEDLKELVSRQEANVNQNLEILAQTLRTYVLERGNHTRAIVFVRTRMLADAVSSWLCKCGEADLMSLNAKKFTSTNKPEELGGMSESQQRVVLDQFQTGEVRVLVATSVGEEGLDIPQCNLVVKYNHTGNEVGKVQTRGRSRAQNGISILLGLPDVLRREKMNRIRVQLMEAALAEINRKGQNVFRQWVENYQAKLYQKWDYEELIKAQQRLQIRDVNFKVYCHFCKRLSVQSSEIRTIYEKYRVSINRELLNHILIHPVTESQMDQLVFVGVAMCLGETEAGKVCGNTIGSVIKHKGCPFVCLGIKNIVFQCDGETPRTFKQWKKVPYCVEELNDSDLWDYAMTIFPPPDRE